MAYFDVHVVDEDQRPLKSVRVVLEFVGIFRGVTAEEYTDSEGHAEFDGYDEGTVEVFVDGSNYGTYHYIDGESITITK